MTRFRVGIDLGGTKTEAVLLNPQGEEVDRKRIPTPKDEGYDAICGSIAALVREIADRNNLRDDYALGVGIPGSLDTATGLVRNANTTCLIGRPFKTDLERLTSREIGMANDANCFTLAEVQMGAAKGYGLVFGVIMGTGCGGGICIDGQVREGLHGIAGEWGHFVAAPAGRPCYCGRQGCIETLISGSGVEKAYVEKFGARRSMREIVAGYREGDSACASVFRQFLDDFGRCLGGVISILDPDAVVIGGGLSQIDELYTEGMERVRHYAFHEHVRTPVLRNCLGDSAGVFGAAWIGV